MSERNSIRTKEQTNADEMRFIRIFHQCEYKLLSLATRLTKSEQYAKDIIQEVFLKFWDQRGSISNIKDAEAWLYRMTENKVIDFFRKAAVNERLKKALFQNLQEKTDSEALSAIEAKEFSYIIQKAIDRLPAQRKLIYQMNREKGLSYQEIAEELSVSRHTVKNQLSSALQSIRHFLAQSSRIFSFF